MLVYDALCGSWWSGLKVVGSDMCTSNLIHLQYYYIHAYIIDDNNNIIIPTMGQGDNTHAGLATHNVIEVHNIKYMSYKIIQLIIR